MMRRLQSFSILVLLATAVVYFHLHNLYSLQRKSSTQAIIVRDNDADNNLPPPPPPHARDDNAILRVASWNLRVPFPPDAAVNLSWEDRRDSAANAIAERKPHLLAVQEDCYFMNDYLMNSNDDAVVPLSLSTSFLLGEMKKEKKKKKKLLLSDTYNRYGLFNRNGESHPTDSWPENAFSPVSAGRDGEHNSIWYDKQRFLAMKNTTFWLSRTPTVPGSSFDEVTGRVANCVLLQDRLPSLSCNIGNNNINNVAGINNVHRCARNHIIFYCSTHLPSGNTTRQLWSVNVLSQMFLTFHDDFTRENNISNGPDENKTVLMMVAGDFNAAPGSDTYNAMIEAGFVDTRSRLVSTAGSNIKPMGEYDEYANTTNDWYDSENDALIDYIWIYLGKERSKHQQLEEGGGHRPSVRYNNVLSVRHIPIPCCNVNLTSDDNDYGRLNNNKTASDHLMIIADFSAA